MRLQAVRDEILNIMHRNNIGEKRGTWMEDWHQKLHNNTTPDDVAICEAFIAFLKSGATAAPTGACSLMLVGALSQGMRMGCSLSTHVRALTSVWGAQGAGRDSTASGSCMSTMRKVMNSADRRMEMESRTDSSEPSVCI